MTDRKKLNGTITMAGMGREVVIKGGFSWVAMIFGPFWAMFKGFWPAAIALGIINYGLHAGAKEASHSGYPFVGLSIFVIQIAIAILFGFYANRLYVIFLLSLGYELSGNATESRAI